MATTTATATTTFSFPIVLPQDEIQRLDVAVGAYTILVAIGENDRVIELEEGGTYRVRCIASDGQATGWISENGQDLDDDGQGLLEIRRASRLNSGLFRCRSLRDHSKFVSVDFRLSSSKRGKDLILKEKMSRNFFLIFKNFF
jgi:hypothetical protein